VVCLKVTVMERIEASPPRRRLRRVLKWGSILAGALLAFLGLAVAVVVVAEWTYIDRMRHHPVDLITNVAWYVPKEKVPGGGGVHLPVAPPEAITIDPAALEDAARLADAKNSSALVVVHDGRVVLEQHWRGHRPGDWTNSASMAKTITALLIGIARDEGRIRSLDAPASEWLPAWRSDARRKITLRHLLQMHSGLKPMGAYEEPFSDASYLALGTDMRYVVDHVEAVEEPGRRFDYNNVNFQALGFVLEATTGRRYAEYLSEKLWKPLGASDAALWLDCEGGSARTFGYLFATTTDWAKAGLLLLHHGKWDGRQIVSREFFQELITPSATEPFYGLGIWLERADRMANDAEGPFQADGIFYLDGHSKQRVYVAPSQRLVIVRVGENARDWDESALVNAVLRGLAPSLARP
jgi:CubicO group peptidase (beta-lactamase class C family)